MVKCTNCENRWPLRAIIKRYSTLEAGMNCPHCGEVQYLSREYRKRSLLATLLIPLLILIPAFINVSFIATAFIFVLAFMAIVSVHLFTMELAGGEEAGWGQESYGESRAHFGQ